MLDKITISPPNKISFYAPPQVITKMLTPVCTRKAWTSENGPLKM